MQAFGIPKAATVVANGVKFFMRVTMCGFVLLFRMGEEKMEREK